ncbi:OriC replication inhibitor [Leclercia adecarboxylata]|uniref:OriC replication inhibitor n=1 Tax=Leclercia adecarboxylata TaxID=83655 RepID=A0A4U9IIK0_9ENTR|nr:OriC replication inhibitor [Leclercia adecarboxylata]
MPLFVNADSNAQHKKLCITQSAVSQRIKQLENMFGQPLLVRTVPPRPTEQGQKLLALLRQVELLEDEWLGDEQTGSTPLLLSLAVNADSLATWLLPALAPVLADSPIRLNLQVEDETRTQERLRRGEVVGAVSIQPQALPSCLVDQLGALDYLFVASKAFAERYFPNGVTRAALLKAPAVAFDHLDDMHQAFLQQNFDLPPGSVPCHIVNSSEAFVQLARPGHDLLHDPTSADRERAEQRRADRPDARLTPAPYALLAPLCTRKPDDAQRHRCTAGPWS